MNESVNSLIHHNNAKEKDDFFLKEKYCQHRFSEIHERF